MPVYPTTTVIVCLTILLSPLPPILSSELIDTLNATNHVRALLTAKFLLDSAFDAHENA